MIAKEIEKYGLEFKYNITKPNEPTISIFRKDNVFISLTRLPNQEFFIELIERITTTARDFESLNMIPSFHQRTCFSGIVKDKIELEQIIEYSYNRASFNGDKLIKNEQA